MEVPAPKPYEFVPFPQGSPKRQQAAGHHEFRANRLSGTLRLKLTAMRPVQVASGRLDLMRVNASDEVVATDVTVRRGGERTHVLPGSSLKGTIRSVVEAISPSCVRVTSWRTRRAMPRRLNPCNTLQQLCPACRLFGMTGGRRENYLGQVHVEDAVWTEGRIVLVRTPLLWAPARGRASLPPRYLQGGEVKGRKFYYHGQPAIGPDARLAAGTGAVFTAALSFANLSPEEMGLLWVALGQHSDYPFLLKIGAAKPVGMGSVSVEIQEVELFPEIAHVGRVGRDRTCLQGADIREQGTKWIEAADQNGLLDAQALKELWELWKEEKLSRESPKGLY